MSYKINKEIKFDLYNETRRKLKSEYNLTPNLCPIIHTESFSAAVIAY